MTGRAHCQRQVTFFYLILSTFFFSRIKKKAFNAIRKFPKFLREEEAREKRKAELRKKVASLLPDFEPSTNRSSLTSSIGD